MEKTAQPLLVKIILNYRLALGPGRLRRFLIEVVPLLTFFGAVFFAPMSQVVAENLFLLAVAGVSLSVSVVFFDMRQAVVTGSHGGPLASLASYSGLAGMIVTTLLVAYHGIATGPAAALVSLCTLALFLHVFFINAFIFGKLLLSIRARFN